MCGCEVDHRSSNSRSGTSVREDERANTCRYKVSAVRLRTQGVPHSERGRGTRERTSRARNSPNGTGKKKSLQGRRGWVNEENKRLLPRRHTDTGMTLGKRRRTRNQWNKNKAQAPYFYARLISLALAGEKNECYAKTMVMR